MSDAGQYDATSEVRFAVVLYGGVSLAIYMNGIVQELLQLVRATAPAPDDPGHLWWADDDLSGAGPVYRRLGRMLDRGVAGAGDGPVRTRFVVDIVTGTSAGGINGVFLAKALATDRDISALSDLWVDEGDIDKLLNDRRAVDGVPPLHVQRPPLSLLSGQRMLYLLLKALDGVSRARPRPAVPDPTESPYAAQIDLWITATDLQGRPVTVETWNPERLGDIREANHRTTFHFRYDATNHVFGDDDPSSTSAIANTFTSPHDPVLAFAARCTSSFPGAFQAVQLRDLDDVVPGVRAIAAAVGADHAGPDWVVPGDVRLEPFFADYGSAEAAALHSFADGGYLDNQPVDLVLETLPKRRADLPVARRILLVDPDPGGEPQRTGRPADPDEPPPSDVPLTGDRIDVLGTVLKVVTLPRVQTIGGDVEKILALREPCRVRTQVYAALDAQFNGDQPSMASTPSTVAYLALRQALGAREVGEAVARVGFPNRLYPAGSQHHAMATRLVSAWQSIVEAEDGVAGRPNTFLDDLDLGFELRRINFLQGRIGSDMRTGPAGDEFARRSAVRHDLDKVYVALATRGRRLRFRDPNPDEVVLAARQALGVMQDDVDFAAPPTDIDGELRARLQPGQPLRQAVDGLLGMFSAGLELARSREDSFAAVATEERLTALWHRFAAYDEATLPLRDLLPGENDDIEVLRVSPRDTWRLVDDATRGPKLAGTRVHHFGGFFSSEWRRNDILWGRLDAAERLISALWPATGAASGREQLISDAHTAIIREVLHDDHYRALLGRLLPNGLPARTDAVAPVPEAEVQSVLTAIKVNYQPPPPPPARTNVELAARAARVADGVAKGLPLLPGPLQPVRTWASRVVRFAAGFVEVALPNRVSSLLGRHLLDVAVIAAILMIVLGGLVGGPGVTSFGWVVLLTVVGVRLAIAMLSSWLAGGRWKLGVAAAGVVVVALVVYGLLSWSGWPRALALLGIGLALGLLLGILPRLLRKHPTKEPRSRPPVVAAALAAVVLVAIASAAVGHGHNDLGERLCGLDDGWLRTVATRVAVVSCEPT